MILIYTHITSARLQYISRFIFKELMQVEFSITIDTDAFINYTGVKINYSDRSIPEQGIWLNSNPLLFEELVIPQHIICFNQNNYKAFFKTPNADYPFDIFAATFYLLSRYEEYLPHTKDNYGRYAHENSLAFKEGFLNLPLINIWVQDFANSLKNKFPSFSMQFSKFSFQPTYDIDMAYSYKHKGWIRNTGGFIKSPSFERIKVLLGLKQDPFDAYAWLDELHMQFNMKPIYFFLTAQKNSAYDKNILPHNDAMWRLVKQHVKKYNIGMHPSWQSGDHTYLLKKEKEQLEAMAEGGQAAQCLQVTLTKSRQHYIRFSLPHTYRELMAAGITDDYSMGYGSINGFRASVAASFFWYDLENEEQTSLRIHPFCFMEANAYYEQKLSAQQAYAEMMHYYAQCKNAGGTLITIWHNNFLGHVNKLEDWKEIYKQFIAQARQ